MEFDPTALSRETPQEVFAWDPAEVAKSQLQWARKRFDHLRPQIPVLDSVAIETGVDVVAELNDLAPLCFPHTVYKSYSATHVEQGRYDRLTRWLNSLTAEDLSDVDVSRCNSLESWLDAVEEASRLRPLVSSGTTGKISFFPRSTVESDAFFHLIMQALAPYGDEPGAGLENGAPEWFSPVPMATGRQSMTRFFALIRARCYHGDASRMHTLGAGHWNADMLWLAGRMRAAERRGEATSVALTPALRRAAHELKRIQADAAENFDRFFDDLMTDQRGRRVVLFAMYPALVNLATECRRRDLQPQLHPDSFILTGGGTKGHEFPDGWLELIHSVFPPPYAELYAMTESTASARLCSTGWYHLPPTVIPFLLDPDTSEPRSRQGTQTGRFALFDLCAETHWGGAITGDRVTIDWEGGCACGRRGPRVDYDVKRFSELRDDDKITCAKSPGAYERAVESLGELA